jgi:copper(I)-binding protein
MSARRLFFALGASTVVLLAGLAVPASAAGDEVKAGPLTITQAWARASIGEATNSAAYMTIANSGDKPDRLVAVKTDGAGETMLHESRMEDGVMKMVHLHDGIEIPAQGKAELKPLGMHVMLMDLKTPLKEGASLPLTLTFATAGEVKVEAKVAKQAPSSESSVGEAPAHEHHHH